jgi:hypothetical protein
MFQSNYDQVNKNKNIGLEVKIGGLKLILELKVIESITIEGC